MRWIRNERLEERTWDFVICRSPIQPPKRFPRKVEETGSGRASPNQRESSGWKVYRTSADHRRRKAMTSIRVARDRDPSPYALASNPVVTRLWRVSTARNFAGFLTAHRAVAPMFTGE